MPTVADPAWRGAADAVAGDDGDALANALIARVGARIRGARKAKGWTQRTLADRSGVSPRYIAQLEAGEGNISIGRLQHLAHALERRMERLVAPDDAMAREVNEIVALYRTADAATRTQVLEVLDPGRLRERKAGRLCLIGLRGAGKSTLGALVAQTFGVPFVELNARIARHAGMPTGEIIALYGTRGYRQMEADALDAVVAAHRRVVLAVGGGLVEDDAALSRVLSRFHTVWLRAAPSEHMERVRGQGDMRPMANNPRAMIQLREILRTREALYEKADHALDTTNMSVARSHAQLADLVRVQGLLEDRAPRDAGEARP